MYVVRPITHVYEFRISTIKIMQIIATEEMATLRKIGEKRRFGQLNNKNVTKEYKVHSTSNSFKSKKHEWINMTRMNTNRIIKNIVLSQIVIKGRRYLQLWKASLVETAESLLERSQHIL